MKNVNSILFILLIALMSCTQSEKENVLNDIDSYIEERPDSAMTRLTDFDTHQATAKEKAKHALLLSMAIDKSYKDTTTFDILQPAIDYYRSHGTDYDKMRTLYYEGRIYTNKNDNASATSCFLKALDCGDESDYILMRARISVACGIAYDRMYQLKRGTEMHKKSAEYFKELGKKEAEITCYFRIIRNCIMTKDSVTCGEYIDLCENMLDDVSAGKRYRFYGYRIEYASSLLKSQDKLRDLINQYQEDVPDSLRDYLDISVAYYDIGEYDKALEAIKEYENRCTDKSIRYHSVNALINGKLGKYDEAFTSLMKYVSTDDSISVLAEKQEALIVENAHNIELQKIKSIAKRDRVIFIMSTLCVILIFAFSVVRYRLKLRSIKSQLFKEEAARYQLQYIQLEKEYDELKNLSNKYKQDNGVRSALNERIALLNKFLSSYILNDSEFDRRIDNEMKKLVDNKEDFIKNTRLSFYGSHPAFIETLKERGLTENEINYCCLYALGLKGKDIGAYIKMKSHYNMSSDIREKLGINEHETNLGLYIRKMLD
jgi:hypothetical protein